MSSRPRRKSRASASSWRSGPSELALSLPKGPRTSREINRGFSPGSRLDHADEEFPLLTEYPPIKRGVVSPAREVQPSPRTVLLQGGPCVLL